jgi:two-component system chemotaxis response regulator CheB
MTDIAASPSEAGWSPTFPARVPVIAVGASGAAGLQDLRDFVAALPEGLPAAVAVVLHRPADRKSALADVLRRACVLPVRSPRPGELLRAGRCYVGDPDRHLAIGSGPSARLIHDGAYRNRAIDLLLRTSAREAGPRAVGVVLSGWLDDGARGLAQIQAAGGLALVADPTLTPAADMPRAALAAVPKAIVGAPQVLAERAARRVAAFAVGDRVAFDRAAGG